MLRVPVPKSEDVDAKASLDLPVELHDDVDVVLLNEI